MTTTGDQILNEMQAALNRIRSENEDKAYREYMERIGVRLQQPHRKVQVRHVWLNGEVGYFVYNALDGMDRALVVGDLVLLDFVWKPFLKDVRAVVVGTDPAYMQHDGYTGRLSVITKLWRP
jgi:hypothetical protein